MIIKLKNHNNENNNYNNEMMMMKIHDVKEEQKINE